MTTTELPTRCSQAYDCRETVTVANPDSGESSCETHRAHYEEGERIFYAEETTPAPAEPRRLLMSQSGTVHAPVTPDQQHTSGTRCAPFGKMGSRQQRNRWVTEGGKYQVTCKRCQ